MLLKRAIRATHDKMASEDSPKDPDTPEDRVGITMAFLKAFEANQLDRAAKLAARYAPLRELTGILGRNATGHL